MRAALRTPLSREKEEEEVDDEEEEVELLKPRALSVPTNQPLDLADGAGRERVVLGETGGGRPL